MTEAQLHKAVAQYLARVLPSHWRFSTFPSGGGGLIRGAQLKARGLARGWPDILLLSNEGRWVGLELKAKKGRTSAEQDDFIRWSDYSAFVCRSVCDVEDVLITQGIPVKARLAA